MKTTFKQWLEETSTIPQLDAKARQAFPNTRKRQNDTNSVIPMSNMIIFVPNPQKQELVIDSRTRSPRSGTMHVQRIMLYKVEFGNIGENGVTPLPNTQVGIKPYKLTADTARVACDCMDFRFRFAQQNHNDDSLAGNPPPAYSKVPGSNRPEANPSGLPGMCKHLMRIVQELKQKRIVV